MKILLLGEFSGLHKNLKEGLVELGHEVTIASSGDGWKKIENDINWGSTKKGLLGNAESFLKLLRSVPKFTGYDVVQLISPVVFPKRLGMNDYILDKLFSENGKVFLIGAGCNDWPTADFLKDKFIKKELYQEILKNSGGRLWCQTKEGRAYLNSMLEKINGFIPVMYEYAQGYRDINYTKLKSTIPLPINTDKIKYYINYPGKKIVYFHGLNREGVKGTDIIIKAMESLKSKYPNDVEIKIEGKLPLADYLKILTQTNVVIDQAYSVSYGMNAIYNMALGRVVIGGGSSKCLGEFDVKTSPLIPIESPTVEEIEAQMKLVLEKKNIITELGIQSRKYVEDVHNYISISKRYLEVWS